MGLSDTIKLFSVAELNDYLSKKLESDPLLRILRVRGEVINLSEYGQGNVYFDLKDENSKIPCVLFNQIRKNIEFELKNGDEIEAVGEIIYFKKHGNIRLKVIGFKFAGEGAYIKEIEKLKKRLEKEGLFDPAKKKKLPLLPEGIGIITPKDSAALKDVIETIRKRFPNVNIYVKPTIVQGEKAVEDICKSIEYFDNFENVDLIIIARGGGSIEDFEPFNAEKVARAIFNAKKPIITGIGHGRDKTIADLVADYSAITPTEAGKIAVPDKTKLLEELNLLEHRLTQAFESFKEKKRLLAEKEKIIEIKRTQEIELKKARKVKRIYLILILVLVTLLLLLTVGQVL